MNDPTKPEYAGSSLRLATMIADRRSQAGLKRTIGSYQAASGQRQQHAGEAASGGFMRTLALSTLALCMLSVALYASAEIFGDGISRAGYSENTEPLEIVVANSVLNIPKNTIRFASQRRAGSQERIELHLHWPSMRGYSDDIKQAFSKQESTSSLIFLTIEPRSMSFDMSGRLEPIYSVFFEGIGIEEGNGLVRQPLAASGGYIDEDMYYQPNSPYPFATRCVREISNIGAPMCLRDIHIGNDLMITYRFHKRFLQHWIALDSAVIEYARSMMTNRKVAASQ